MSASTKPHLWTRAILLLAARRRRLIRRRRIEESLRASEERYRLLTAAVPQQIWTAGPDGHLDYINSRAFDYFGRTAEDETLYGTGWLEVVHPEDVPSAVECWTRSLETGEPYETEFRLRRADGEYRWHLAQAFPVRDAEGRINKWFGTNTDIHDRKLTEESLRKSEGYRNLFRHANDAIMIFEPESEVVIDVNDRACKIYGIPRDEFIGRSIKEMSQDAARGEQQLEHLLVEGTYQEFETVQYRADGTSIRFLINASVIEFQGRRAVLTINRDVTEQKRAQERLQRSEERFRTLTENVPIGIYRTTPDGRVLVSNSTLLRLLGFDSLEELAAFNLERDDIGAHRQREEFKALVEKEGEVWGYETVWTKRDGSEVNVRENARTIRDAQGQTLYYEGTVEDISERLAAEEALRQSEAQLRQTQKMESIGTLAGGVAHDFNNLLTAINGYSDLTLRQLEEHDPLRHNIEEIKKAGERATALTQQLLAFSRRQTLERKNINLNETITNMMKMLTRIIGEDIEVRFAATGNLQTVCADAGQIEQVVMNLAINARDAMPDGGQVIIETHNVTLGDDYCRRHSYAKPGKYARIMVSDTGTGMDADTLKRIFEPFFTTKGLGRGTGLGLSMVFGIVKQHDGFIEVYSEVGQGTIFKLYLPVEERMDDKETHEALAPVRGGRETILVAEDEETLRELVRDVLEDLGYTVLLAKDGEEAVELFAAHRDRVDLLMFDMVMPRLSGSEAYERVRSLAGDVSLILMTGYSEETVQSRFVKHHRSLEEAKVVLLQKPYGVEALGRKVREVLDGTRD